MTTLMKPLIERLREFPEEEQEAVATSSLRDLRRRKRQRERGQSAEENTLYEPFQIMLDADLDLPSDDAETYEEYLYGPHGSDD